MDPAKINYKIYQGTTFTQTFRWESDSISYANIVNISKTAPAVITVSNVHNLPIGWRFRVTDVVGMKQINNIDEDSYYICTSKSPTTISSDQINSASFSNYTSGGIVSWQTPVPLTGYSAVLQVRKSIDSATPLFTLTSAPGQGIVIDPTNYTITISLTNTQTSALNFSTGLYGLELTDASGNVTQLIRGTFVLIRELVK